MRVIWNHDAQPVPQQLGINSRHDPDGKLCLVGLPLELLPACQFPLLLLPASIGALVLVLYLLSEPYQLLLQPIALNVQLCPLCPPVLTGCASAQVCCGLPLQQLLFSTELLDSVLVVPPPMLVAGQQPTRESLELAPLRSPPASSAL